MKTLDINKKPDTKYAIPDWLRDEQVKSALARDLRRIEPGERRSESIAVVGYGPSLVDTWEKIREFAFVISCSGAHRFLIDRGIIPTWHVAVDPLPSNTVKLIGQPHPEVQYLICSTCHPDVFDHLASYDVRLWHSLSTEETALRLLPHGDWAITGGCDVGLRSLTLAAFLGFRDLYVFGLDGSCRAERHAGAHPSGGDVSKFPTVEYNGVTYRTTPAMLAAAQMVKHEMEQMPVVKATFYGEGLIQAMMRDCKPTPTSDGPMVNHVGFAKEPLISAEYVRLNADLHRTNLAYGVGGGRHAHVVTKMCEALKTTSVLDYGCGKGYLAKEMPFPIWEYDPAIPGKQESPRPADIVVCTDVLEHIEPDKLVAVLRDLQRVMRQAGYFVIHMGQSSKTLADGRNSHLIVQDADWWRRKLGAYFALGESKIMGPLLHIVVGPPAKQRKTVLTPQSIAEPTTDENALLEAMYAEAFA